MEDRPIGIVGAGPMGQGICQLIAGTSRHIVLSDIDPKALEEAIERIAEGFDEEVRQKKLTEWVKDKTLKNIKLAARLDDLTQCGIIIEAISEKEEMKMELFEVLDDICPDPILFASSTASLSITRLASVTGRPEKFVGIHFIHPATQNKLVEIIRGWHTSDEVFEQAKQFVGKLGKIVILSEDSPGFIVNRVLITMINEAIFAMSERVADPATIDTAMMLATGQALGPLAQADLMGLDTCLDILETLFAEFGETKYRPAHLLRKYVEAGFLGRKTGKGFYTYESEKKKLEAAMRPFGMGQE